MIQIFVSTQYLHASRETLSLNARPGPLNFQVSCADCMGRKSSRKVAKRHAGNAWRQRGAGVIAAALQSSG
jgi:hypothetical protein